MDLGICKRPDIDDTIGREDVVVVVDALRASATAATLLAVGAEYVRPVTDVDPEAVPQEMVLVGEENGERIEGFDFCNSPTEIRQRAPEVDGKGTILRTTNGTQCVSEVDHASEVYMGSLVNESALTRALRDGVNGRDSGHTWFVPARKQGEYAREDMYTCLRLREALADSLDRDVLRASDYLGDSATEAFTHSKTGQHLASLGFHDDVEFCSSVDVSPAVPRLEGDRFVGATDR